MKTMSETKTGLPIILIIFVAYAHYIAGDKLSASLQLIAESLPFMVFGLVGVLSVGGIAYSCLFLASRFYDVKKEAATALKLRREAEVFVIQNGNQVFVSDKNMDSYWKSMHLQSKVVFNTEDRNEPPTAIELSNWRQLNIQVNKSTTTNNLLIGDKNKAEDTDKGYVILRKVFMQHVQSFAIIGGQQTGKTFQAQHIANCWLAQGIQPIVIGPKFDIGEWAGCKLIGGQNDYGKVADGLAMVQAEARRRHADKDTPHKEHPILPVFFDDWTPVIKNVEIAEQLIFEATTLFCSVNIILYFIIHSDTANAWGVGKVGAALKNNFVKLMIHPYYDNDGVVNRRKTRGVVVFPSGEERPTKLINEPLQALPAPPEQAKLPDLQETEPEPTDREMQVLNLWEDGSKKTEIARIINGSKKVGGKQVNEVTKILKKFELID